MKHYITKVERVKKQYLDRVTCDRCGSVVPEEETGDRREFNLRFAKGYGYPDGGSLEGWQVSDLCDDCVAILKDLLNQNGFTVSNYEIDW